MLGHVDTDNTVVARNRLEYHSPSSVASRACHCSRRPFRGCGGSLRELSLRWGRSALTPPDTPQGFCLLTTTVVASTTPTSPRVALAGISAGEGLVADGSAGVGAGYLRAISCRLLPVYPPGDRVWGPGVACDPLEGVDSVGVWARRDVPGAIGAYSPG